MKPGDLIEFDWNFDAVDTDELARQLVEPGQRAVGVIGRARHSVRAGCLGRAR